MKHNISLFLLLGTLLPTVSQPPVYAQDSGALKAQNTGIRSALQMARFLGRTPDQALTTSLGEAFPQTVVSASDVQQAAGRVGVQLKRVRLNLKQLEKRGQPFIAALPSRFVFVERVEGEWVRSIENEIPSVVPFKEFETQYQGQALILAASEKQGALQITPSIISWDKVPFGSSEKVATVMLSNTGKTPIAIDDVSTSCSCTVPSQWPHQILPGQKVPLKITVRVPAAGKFSQIVTIFSKTATPVQIVSLFGRVETDVSLDPAQIGFGEVILGSTIVKTLVVSDADHKLPRPLQVATTDTNLISQITPQTQDSWKIDVTLSASRLGEVDEGLLISGANPGSRVVRVPVRGRVVPMTRARPEQVVFGSVAPEGASRRLKVFRQDRQPFRVMDVVVPPYLRWEMDAPDSNGAEWNARISIDPALAPAQVTAKIVVKTIYNGQEEVISVPVLALNEGNPKSLLPGVIQAALLPRAEDDLETPIGLPLPRVKVGEMAPDFRVEDAQGNPWRLSSLRGQKNVLLTFFPKCFTGGCATQLSSLRDHQSDFDATGTQIIAISVDSAEGDKGQIAFSKQWGLQFPLIPDTNRRLGMSFGALQNPNERAARLSFLIDKKGIVVWVDIHVNVQTHGPEMLFKIHELGLDK